MTTDRARATTDNPPIFSSVWGECAKVAIRVVQDSKVLDDPQIVCTNCDDVLTTLADMDTVASLITLSMEHTCVRRFETGR